MKLGSPQQSYQLPLTRYLARDGSASTKNFARSILALSHPMRFLRLTGLEQSRRANEDVKKQVRFPGTLLGKRRPMILCRLICCQTGAGLPGEFNDIIWWRRRYNERPPAARKSGSRE